MSEWNEEKAKKIDILAALNGAIGWIAATTNEGNHRISEHTRGQLVAASRFIREHYPDDKDAQ